MDNLLDSHSHTHTHTHTHTNSQSQPFSCTANSTATATITAIETETETETDTSAAHCHSQWLDDSFACACPDPSPCPSVSLYPSSSSSSANIIFTLPSPSPSFSILPCSTDNSVVSWCVAGESESYSEYSISPASNDAAFDSALLLTSTSASASASASAASSPFSAPSPTSCLPSVPNPLGVLHRPVKLPEKSSRERLDRQKRSDRRRRKLQKNLFDTIRDTLKSANEVRKRARIWTDGVAMGMGMGMGMSANVEEDLSSQRRKVDNLNGDEMEESGDAELDDERTVQTKAVEKFSAREVMLAASDAIRELNTLKEKLQAQLDSTDNEMIQDETLNVTSSTEEKTRKVPMISSSSHLTVNELLDAIQQVNRKYLTEINAVRSFETYFLPRYVSDLSCYFPHFSVVGLDATFIHAEQMNWDTFSSLSNVQKEAGKNFFGTFNPDYGWREVFTNQLHALVSIVANGKFKYRNFKDGTFIHSVTPKSSSTSIRFASAKQSLPDVDTTTLNSVQISQMLRDSTFAPPVNFSSATATEPMTVNQLLNLNNPEAHSPSSPSSSASASASAASSSCLSSSSLSSSLCSSARAGAGAGADAAAAAAAADALVLQHPLGPFSLPAESFTVFQEVLDSWIALGKDAYEEQIDNLLPFAMRTAPECFVKGARSTVHHLRHQQDSLRSIVFSPVFCTDYEHLIEFYLLWTGRKPVIELTLSSLLPGCTCVSYLQVSAFIIRHPVTSLPLALLAVPRKFFFGQEEFTTIETRAYDRARRNQRKIAERRRAEEMWNEEQRKNVLDDYWSHVTDSTRKSGFPC